MLPPTAPLEGREFDFSQEDFQAVRTLIYGYAGIALNNSKYEMVYSRLTRRLRALGLKRFTDYIKLIKQDDSDERQIFINALTTNLTSFFREAHHFHLLVEHLKTQRIQPPLSVWSAGCSTGEEAYSLAMTLAELYGTDARHIKVLASDIDTDALAAAARGVYSMERLEALPSFTLKRFFMRGVGKNEGYARVRQELRDMLTFKPVNLRAEQWGINEKMAAIFCRNVMIYFDKPTQYEILRRFAPLLQPNGLLFAGHSESFYHAADLFRMREKTVYELAAAARSLT